MVKLTALIVFMTLITVASSVAAVVMSWWQVKAAEQTQKQAEADGNEEKKRTQTALHIAAEQAKSTRAAVDVAMRALKLQGEQNATAKSALLIDQTPQISIAANGLGTVSAGGILESQIKVTNTGQNTLYNANTYTQMALSAKPLYPFKWSYLPWRGKDTLGPTDSATYGIYHTPLKPEQFLQLRAGRLFVIVASRTIFVDAAGRKHARYLCQFHGVAESTFVPDECPTPPQY